MGENVTLKYGEMGPGKSMYMFSAERLPLSAPRQTSVGRASRRGSGKQKAEDVRQKTYMLIYPDPGEIELRNFRSNPKIVTK